jgi:transcriptional regulator with XRE-family HTH domain
VITIHQIIGANIRFYRKKLGLTQEALAGKISFTSNYVACVERSEEKLSIDGLARIAKALKIPPHMLLIPQSYKEE